MTEQVSWKKSSLLLKNILLNTQPLKLFMMNIKTENIHKKLLKMPSWKTWVERPRGLLKEGMECKRLK
jgi:hypothetical protein